MTKKLARLVVLVLAAGGVAFSVTAVWFLSGGISARNAPGQAETRIARTLRALAIPRGARNRNNPTGSTPEIVRAGMEHFADHCAVCHANDGSGETEMGRGLYPRPPDMRRPQTQSLSDGELFYIIEHGVRLTGMPAWGDGSAESELASWHLVRFIRHLPTLSDAEIAEMEALNPKSPEEWRGEEDARRFLEGSAEPPRPTAVHKHGGRK
jgi:mono/diheme cytochrome c family protein